MRSRKWFNFGSSARIEFIRISIALGVAVLGLIAGAKEELLKFDIIGGLIAVFLIGFGADAVKGILSKQTLSKSAKNQNTNASDQ